MYETVTTIPLQEDLNKFWKLRKVKTRTQLRAYLGRSPTDEECIVAIDMHINYMYSITHPSCHVRMYYDFKVKL